MSTTATPPTPKAPGYDYSYLIKPGMTNEQKLSILMNHSRAGGLIQGFIMEGLRIYSNQVLADKDKLRESFGPRPFINPEAWIACAEDVLSALTSELKPKMLTSKEAADDAV